MATNLEEFRLQVDFILDADDDIIGEKARDRQIKSALERYSIDQPDTQTDDVTGDAGRYYAIASELSSWSEGFSRITQIEYPAATIASDEAPVYLNREDWQDDYWAAVSGTQTRHLYLPNHAPAATETMRITYTIPYAFSGTPESADIPPQDFYAICELAAAYICRAMATKFAKSSDSTINVDAVDHRSKSQEFRSQAKEHMKAYLEHVGLDADKESKTAGEFVDMDTAPGWPGSRQYLFHGRGLR